MKQDQLSDVQRKLAAQIGLLLHRRVAKQVSQTSGQDPAYRYAGEDGADFLIRFGICKKGSQPHEYIFNINEGSVVEVIETYPRLTSTDYETLLHFFFRFFIGHGRLGCLSHTRKPFTPSNHPKAIVECLIDAGFLTRQEQQVLWNDSAANLMESHGHWKDGVSKHDLRMLE